MSMMVETIPVDALGVRHPPAEPEPRIVSLVPSLTELIVSMGLLPNLVGRTRYCVHPIEQLRDVAIVGGTKRVQLDRIRDLGPTHVVVNVEENSKDIFERLSVFVPHVIVTHPVAPTDNLHLYQLLGGIFGRRVEARTLSRALTASLERVRSFTGGMTRRSVLYLIWKDPWMTVSRDTYASRTLALFGFDTLPEISDMPYPTIEPTDDRLTRVDDVLLSSEPFPFEQIHIDEVCGAFGVPRKNIHLIDGAAATWYGSHAIEGLDVLLRLRQVLNP